MEAWYQSITSSLRDDSAISATAAAAAAVPFVSEVSHPWTASSNKMMERAGTLLQANYYPCRSDLSPDVDLDSWQKIEPQQWSSDDVMNMIYDLAGKCDDISMADLRGESFQNLRWPELSRMTEEEFTDREPKYGRTLFKAIRELAQFSERTSVEQLIKVKSESDSSWADVFFQTELPKPVLDVIEEEYFGGESCEKVDPALVSLLGVHEYDTNCSSSGTENLHLGAAANYRVPTQRDFSIASNVYADTFSFGSSLRGETPGPLPDSASPVASRSPATDFFSFPPSFRSAAVADGPWSTTELGSLRHLRQFGSTVRTAAFRPEPESNQETFVGFPYGVQSLANSRVHLRRRSHGNRGNHLWEFMCRLLKASENMNVQDRIIQWENQDDGIFRILNSKEVARLWGKCKRNDLMNYEKLSRALRWCRTYGFLSELPKDGHFPKKLCFRFGPRAVNWRSCI